MIVAPYTEDATVFKNKNVRGDNACSCCVQSILTVQSKYTESDSRICVEVYVRPAAGDTTPSDKVTKFLRQAAKAKLRFLCDAC